MCDHCGLCCMYLIVPMPMLKKDGLFLLKARDVEIVKVDGQPGKFMKIYDPCKYLEKKNGRYYCSIQDTLKPDTCHAADCPRDRIHVVA